MLRNSHTFSLLILTVYFNNPLSMFRDDLGYSIFILNRNKLKHTGMYLSVHVFPGDKTGYVHWPCIFSLVLNIFKLLSKATDIFLPTWMGDSIFINPSQYSKISLNFYRADWNILHHFTVQVKDTLQHMWKCNCDWTPGDNMTQFHQNRELKLLFYHFDIFVQVFVTLMIYLLCVKDSDID